MTYSSTHLMAAQPSVASTWSPPPDPVSSSSDEAPLHSDSAVYIGGERVRTTPRGTFVGPHPASASYDSLGTNLQAPHVAGQLYFPEPNFTTRAPYRLINTVWVAMGLIMGLALIAPLAPSAYSELVLVGLAYEAAALLAALTCYVVSQRVQGQAKLVWTMGALAAAIVSLAQLSWVASLMSTGHPPAPDGAWRIGLLLSHPPVLFALFFLTVGLGRWPAMVRRASDCVLIAGSVLVTTWGVASAAVRDQVHLSGSTRLGWVLSIDLVGVLLIGTLAVVVVAHRRVWRDRVGRVMAGIVVVAGVDGVQTVALLRGWHLSGWLLLLVSTTGMLVVAAATFGVEDSETTAEEPNPSLLSMMLPYACLLLAMACLVSRRILGEPPAVGESMITLLLVMTVLLRHVLSTAETHRLLSTLANREQVMRHQALHDPLTGLANRALFTDRVEHAVTLHARSGQGVVVMFCDLDDFKEVNDSLGHAAGDALLVAIATRMREVVRAGDTVARLGGDEFALLIEQPEADVGDIARRLLMAICAPLNLTQAWVFPSASIGSAYLPPAGPSTRSTTTVTRLLGDADEAMYVAKASGKGRHAGAVNGEIALSAHVGLPYDPLNVALPVGAARISEDPTVPNTVPDTVAAGRGTASPGVDFPGVNLEISPSGSSRPGR